MMEAINSGRYDTDKLALLMSQTGGACRASNYVGFIRKALKEAGYENIPVIAISWQNIETNEGFNLSPLVLQKMIIAVLYGDLIMRLSNFTRAYEKEKETDTLKQKWIEECQKRVLKSSSKLFRQIYWKKKAVK